MSSDERALFKTVDCVQIPVPELDAGIDFYCNKLGHVLNWRSETQAGLRMPDSDAELVLQTEWPEPEVDLLVDSVDVACKHIQEAGGSIAVQPFDIPVGRVAVVLDPFGNALTIIDLSKGRYTTDDQGTVTGVQQ